MIVLPPSGDVEAQREGSFNWSLKEASVDTRPADCTVNLELKTARRGGAALVEGLLMAPFFVTVIVFTKFLL